VRSAWAKKGFFVRAGEISGFFELRSVGFGFFGLFCIGGPTVSAKSADGLKFYEAARELAHREKVLFVQVEPISEGDIPGFQKGEYRHFLEKTTVLLDLSVPEAEILAQMKEKGRYNVRLAEKRGITVRMAEPTEENVGEFARLLRQTLERDGFSGNSAAYYLELVRTLDYEKAGGLFFAEKDDEVLAAAITSFYGGTATYYYGASTSDNEKRRDMPAYALQWGMILEAKKRGCSIYDFLGIAPEGSTGHPLAGVTDFKLKFGGTVQKWPEARILIVRPWAYGAMMSLRGFFRIFRGK
jgi:peptidoglycan pentaglycine glycine transferase (the first glycine)